jgi:hypothetical protein
MATVLLGATRLDALDLVRETQAVQLLLALP